MGARRISGCPGDQPKHDYGDHVHHELSRQTLLLSAYFHYITAMAHRNLVNLR